MKGRGKQPVPTAGSQTQRDWVSSQIGLLERNGHGLAMSLPDQRGQASLIRTRNHFDPIEENINVNGRSVAAIIPEPAANNNLSASNASVLAAINGANDIRTVAESDLNVNVLPDPTAILDRLSKIRGYMRQVLDMIDRLKGHDNEANKEMLEKMVKAYDGFREQERQYLSIMDKVLAIRKVCEDAGVTGDGAIALDNIDVRGHINGMEEPTDQITAQTPTVLDNRRPPGSSANSISSALSSFSGDNTREAATLQLGSSGAIPKKRVAPAPPPKKAQLSENSAGAAENDELRLFQLEKEHLEQEAKKQRRQMEALKEQRDMLQHMLRQQEQLRALQGRQTAIEGQKRQEADQSPPVDVPPISMTPPSIVNSGGTLTEAQQAALAAKEEELNDLKNTLQSLKQLYAQTKSTIASSDSQLPPIELLRSHLGTTGATAAAVEDPDGSTPANRQVLEGRMLDLSTKKHRMDQLLAELNQLQAKNPKISTSSGTTAMSHLTKSSMNGHHNPNLENHNGLERHQPSGVENGEIVDEIDAEAQAAKQHAMNELANAREKLARLQSVVARIEAHGAAVPAELSLELARLVATEVAEVGEGEAELEFLPEVDYEEDEDIDASEDGLAAMSMRARTEYQMKLAEQQDAVERLREERHRLLAIQSELQKLHNSCSVNENPEAEQNYNVSQRLASSQERINPVLNSNEEVWQELRHRAIERESHSQSRPAATRRIIAEPLNNTRDNLSEASTNQRRRLNADMSCAATWGGSQVPESEDELDEENEDGAQSPDLPEEEETEELNDNSRAIINNPRLPGFRRNNELDQPQSRTTSKILSGHAASHNRPPLSPAVTGHNTANYQSSVGSGRGESLTTSLIEQDGRLDDSQQQSNSNSAATPSHRSALLNGPDAEHLHLQQHYHQLQAHIDSIRSIFQDLMQQSNSASGQPSVVSPANSSATNSIPANQPAAATMYPPTPQQFGIQPWDGWNAATMAVQQHQLMVSLLGCQQQLQMQQAEMRQLQMVCQDLLNTGSVNSEPRTPNPTSQVAPMTAHAPLDGRPLSSGSLYNLLAPNPYLTFPYYPPQQGYPVQMSQSSIIQQPMSVRNLPAAGSRSPQVMSQSWHPGVQNYPAHLNNSHKTNTDVINNFSDPVTSLRGRRRMHDANVSGGQTPVPIGKSASHSQVNIFTNNNGPHGRPDSASASGSKLPLNVGMKSSKDVAGSSILRGRSESDASTSAKLPTSSNTEEESPRANNATYSGRRIVNQTGVVPKLDLEDSQKWNTTAKPKNFNTNSAAGNQHQYSSDVGRPGSVDRATTKGATASVTSLNSSSQSRGRANTEAPIQSGDQFENLREVIYSEVATLISQNESRPQFLLELFRELQLLSSDYLRARALQAMREVLNKYLTEETETEDDQMDEVGGNFEYPYQGALDNRQLNGISGDITMSESVVTSDDEKFKPSRSYNNKPLLSSRDKPHDYAETAASASSLSTPEPTGFTDGLSETIISFEKVEANPSKQDHLEEKSTNLSSSSRKTSANNFLSLKSSRQDSIDRTAALADSDRKVDVTDLEVQIQGIVDELIPFLKDNVAETCTPTLLAYLRKLVLTLATNKCPGADSMGGFLHRQLKTILDDTLIKFSGQKLQDCGEELLADVSEVVFNELAFFRLMQNIDSVSVKSKTSERIRKISGIPHSSEETVDAENPIEQSDPESNGEESDGNGTSPESSREASTGPSDSREGSREPVGLNDRSEASDEISAQTTVSVSKEAQRVMALNSASKTVIRRMTSGESDVELETVEGPVYSSDEGKDNGAKESDRSTHSHSHSHRDVEVVITTPLTVQVISPTDDDEEISTSVSQSMHTAANQSYKREGSASGTDSRETTPPDDLLEEQEIPEQIEAELMTADTEAKPDMVDSDDNQQANIPPDSARSLIIHDFESDEPEAVFTINLNFEPHPENEAALSMNLSSRRAWEDSKEKDVDTNDVPESQRGFSSIDGKKEEKAKEVVEEDVSVVTVTFPKLIATSNESVPTDSNKTDVTEPEEPEDEEDITSFTFALPTSDVSCDMNLDISKSDKKKEEP